MTFRKIYPSWDAVVKGPQINDAVLSHNDSLFMLTDFIFTSNGIVAKVFRSQLGPSWELFEWLFWNIDK